MGALLVAAGGWAQENTTEAATGKEAEAETSEAGEVVVAEAAPDRNEEPHGMYNWILADGTEFEASYRVRVGNNIVMESRAGTQKKIPLDRFTPDDIEFFELENPPDFKLNFKPKTKQYNYSDRFVQSGLPVVMLYEFGVSAEQRGAGNYPYEVTLEFFAIASQRGHNDKYILLNHDTTSFVPSKKNDRFHEYWSPRITEVDKYYATSDGDLRGKKYEGYLLILTDKRGKVLDYRTSNEWLYEHADELRNRYIGNYFDETCKRVFPGRPFPLRGSLSNDG